MNTVDRTRTLLQWNIGILAALILITGAVIYFVPSRSSDTNKNPIVAEPLPLAQGRQVYTIASKGNGPKITQAVIDPFDPQAGEMQTFEIYAQHAKPIDDIRIILVTDTASSTIVLAHASGTLSGGIWRGSLTTNDTHTTTYAALVRARSGTSTTPIDLSFR